MSKKKTVRQRILDFLRDPAWSGVRAIQGILAAIVSVILIILAILVGIGNFLLQRREFPIWILAILGLLGLYGTFSLYRIFRMRKEEVIAAHPKISRFEQFHFWGVIWLLDKNTNKVNKRPLCPEHFLPMDIWGPSQGQFTFHCRGEEGEKRHTIFGPTTVQVNTRRPEDICWDVMHRIAAEGLKKQNKSEQT